MDASSPGLTQPFGDTAERVLPPILANERPLPAVEAYVDSVMSSLRIAVIFGGDKSAPDAVVNPMPNSRSWKSYEPVATNIADSLRRLGFRHVQTMPENMHLGDRLRQEGIQFAWINSGGVQGYNPMSHAPALLELLGLPYVGHDPLNASTLDNKHLFKRSLTAFGIPTAPFITWHMARGPFRPKINSRFIRCFRNHWGAFIVKPVCGRASLHVHVVDDERGLPDAVADVFRATENHVLIEAYLPGAEYCVAAGEPYVARNRRIFGRNDPFIFSALQRLLGADERIVTSMDVRPISSNAVRALTASADEAVRIHLHELARSTYLDFNLEGLMRLDVRADAAGTLCILEANPKPDLTRPSGDVTSLVCAGLGSEGMDYDDLILTMIAGRLAFLRQHRPFALPRTQATG